MGNFHKRGSNNKEALFARVDFFKDSGVVTFRHSHFSSRSLMNGVRSEGGNKGRVGCW